MRRLLWLALLAACSSSPKPAAPTAPAAPAAEPAPAAAATPAPAAGAKPTVAKVMTGDTPAADLDGNTFIVPDGWKLETSDAMVLITPPEGDSHHRVGGRSEEHTSELQSRRDLVCRLLLEKKKKNKMKT